MGIFERYLSLWVGLGMLAGVGLGMVAPGAFQAMAALEFAHVNLVVAVFIWMMIYPMMVQIDWSSVKGVGHRLQGLVLTLALSYGGREELVHCMRALAAKVASGALAVDDITEEALASALWTHDLPPVDLVIRSSGEQRLSNFLLWQTAYSEFLFSPIAWPEFRAKEFAEALLHFQTRERRFGLTGAQLRRAGT